jgi:hypothetical protein
MHQSQELSDLTALYRTAFDKWSSEVSRLEGLQNVVPERSVLEDAQRRTRVAEAGYRVARDRLAEEMAPEAMFAIKSENEWVLTAHCLRELDDRSLMQYAEVCEQFCAAAARRKEPPPRFFARRKRFAAEEMTRRLALSVL